MKELGKVELGNGEIEYIVGDTRNAIIEEVAPLLKEARELTAIFTATDKTAK